MKRDYYSDIKLAQRIIFQNTAYLLTMLDKKVDSFTSLKTPNMRARERNDLLHPDNVLHPQAPKAAQNPLASLANDLTKPVWNCSTRFEPIAVSLLPHPASTDYQKMLSAFNYAMGRFFERCKGEHEDEVSLKLHVCLVDKAAMLAAYAEAMGQGNRIQDLLQQLFRLLICANQAKLEKMDLENGIQHQKTELIAAMQILERLTTKNPQTLKHTHPQLLAEICSFTQLAQSHLKNVTESNSGPVYLNYHLQADNLALLLHPMMLASYCFIKNQIAAQEQAKDESSMSNDRPSHSQPPIFEDLKSCNCSKITFINLDGHESSLNLLLAKHLSKYLQYISFPEEQLSLVESDPELKSYFRWRSEMLTKEYLASEAAAQNFSRLFNSKDSSQLMTLNEFYKRLIVIPVKSIRMAQKKQKPDSPFPSVSGYESHFLSFIMKEVIYNQVRQFSPSVIIISHANTLPILPAHFQQIISQLAILTNMRVVFYNNLTHTLLPYAPPPQATGLFDHFHREYSKRREKWSMAALPFSRGENFPLSVDMLQRASIFLKICSGTANLGPQAREDDEKYQNSRVLGYSASIMREVCFKHPALSRYDNRFLQYLKIDKLFSNYYQPKAISWYHKNMVQSVEAVLFQYYGQTLIHSERWKCFSNEFALHMNKVSQSEQAKYFAKLNYPNSLQNDSIYGLIALQFQILENHVRKLITLSTETQIILSRNKHYATCPVFVLNHLSNYKSQTLSNYYGFIDEEVQNSCGARVALQELRFYQNHYNLSPYQHFTEFSYHQTQNSVILFWPLLYDAHQALLHSFSRSAYHPQPTSLFFVGSKSNLAVLSHMQPLNQSYKHLHPRIGCTCYQPPNSNLIYIFGGFYNELANYLDFQTDISVIRMEQSGISIENVPKSFFASQQQRKDFGYSIVTSINNDFVRPRVQYEVYQLQSEDNSTKQIILLGGIGQKFTRPFSLIGYMGHLIRFQHGLLSKIDRIKLNNVVPANLTRPTRQCAPTHLPVIKVAQNKRIYASSSPTRPGTLAFAHFPLRYVSQDPNLDKKCLGRYMARNRRMTYLKSYQVALDQRWVDCENQKQTVNTVMIREGNQARNIRWVLRHYSFGQKRQAQVLLTLDSKRSQTFALAFSLEDDAAQKFVNLEGNVVKLAPQHIIAADTYSLQTYALFCHPEYTQGLTVLARSNVRSINELTDNEINQISVSQIYSLDQSPENHIIKVMQGQQVAVVHGLQFGQTRYEEYLVRRVGSYYTRLRIQSSDFIKQIHEGLLAGDGLLRPNRKSFVLGHGHRLLCLTFVTLHRHSQTTQTTLLIIEQLTLTDPLLKWRVKSTTHVRFEVNFPQQMRSQVQRQPLLVCKEILDVYQISQSKDLFIVVGCENYVFEASTSLQNFNKIHELHFQPIRVANEENELELRHILCDDYESERMRDRQNGYHLYAKAINKGSALKGGSQVMSEERGSK